MAITLYDVTIPVLLRGLDQLGGLLDRGLAFAADQGLTQDALLTARLAPDMLPLSGQVQRASDSAKFVAVRIGGVENQPFSDDEESFEDLQEVVGFPEYWDGEARFAADPAPNSR